MPNTLSHFFQELLDKYLIANATNPESKVFYLKMKGGYFQYLAKVAYCDDRKQMIGNSQGAYQGAFGISVKEMQPTHPVFAWVWLLTFVYFTMISLMIQSLPAHWLK